MGYSKQRPAGRLGFDDDSSIQPLDTSMELIGLVERVRVVCRGYPARLLGEMTGTASETARRYAHGHRPSAEFLMGLCHALGVSPVWLLRGEGPMHSVSLTDHFLGKVGEVQLCMELGRRLERAGVGRARRYQKSTAIQVANGAISSPATAKKGKTKNNGASRNGASKRAGVKSSVKTNGAARKSAATRGSARITVHADPPTVKTRVNGFKRKAAKTNGAKPKAVKRGGTKRRTSKKGVAVR